MKAGTIEHALSPLPPRISRGLEFCPTCREAVASGSATELASIMLDSGPGKSDAETEYWFRGGRFQRASPYSINGHSGRILCFSSPCRGETPGGEDVRTVDVDVDRKKMEISASYVIERHWRVDSCFSPAMLPLFPPLCGSMPPRPRDPPPLSGLEISEASSEDHVKRQSTSSLLLQLPVLFNM